MAIAAPSFASAEFHRDARKEADTILSSAIEASPTGVLVTTPGGEIVRSNLAAEVQFGYLPGELVGLSVGVLLPELLLEGEIDRKLRYLENAQDPGLGVACELTGRRKDGSQIPVEISFRSTPTKAGPLVLASILDISERRHREQEYRRSIHEHLEFERVVGNISASFVNVKIDEIDQAIVDALAQIAAVLDLDRGTVFSIIGDDDFVLTHHWQIPELATPPRTVSARDHFPWSLERIRKGQIACFSSPDEVANAKERESLEKYTTRSRAAIPLQIAGQVVGAIAFASTHAERPWPEEILSRLRLIAQVFSGALARKEADAALRASDQRFRTLANNAPVMIWVGGKGKAGIWFNRQWLDFVGSSLEHEIGDGWVRGVHPDDLESCLKIYNASFDLQEPFSMEYRLRRHDGSWRWVLERGTPNGAAHGNIQGFIGSCIDITDARNSKQQLEDALAEVQRLRDKLQAENVYLRREVQDRIGSNTIVGRSAAIRRVIEAVEQVAVTDSTVLLLGETGTGKELFATQIHELSARHNRAIVRVNCAAIPTTLIESELFGRERGAYTGALTRQIGRFELADHSTIFLDEIGDLPLEVQIKLLRVLEERQFERLGSAKGIHVNVRVIAATHRNLEQRIADGLFREDLFYRLNVFPIHVPPLRERVEDIPLLVWRFVEEFSKAFGKRIDTISRENMTALQEYSWPGNIRELRNVVERAMIGATGTRLTITLPPPSPTAKKHYVALHDVEREHIRSVLDNTGWRIRGSNGAAARLSMKPTTLESRMAKLGLRRPKQV